MYLRYICHHRGKLEHTLRHIFRRLDINNLILNYASTFRVIRTEKLSKYRIVIAPSSFGTAHCQLSVGSSQLQLLISDNFNYRALCVDESLCIK